MVEISGITLYLEILVLAATKLDCLKPPSFVSKWSYIEANTFNAVNIKHNLNSLPAKVEVQVKATDGPNIDFIFPGTSSTQNDNDVSVIRGGAIYIYNENDIIIFSGIGAGTRIIYTGSSVNRIGPNVQSTSNPTFKEINHNLGVHPAYVSVQVQILEGIYAGYYFDGTGTCMLDSTNIFRNHAGVLYAYNETTVRMWMPTNEPGYLFGLIDGWGTFEDKNYITSTKKGKARVLAWKTIGETVMETSTPYGDGVSNEDYEIAVKREDISKEILVIVEQKDARAYSAAYKSQQVQAKDGDNRDFRFPGTGAAMEDPNNDGNYGGIVYSFNESSVRIWIPSDKNNKGFIAFVGGIWGGFYSQASNAVDIVFKVWELQEQVVAAVLFHQNFVRFSSGKS
ncbi:hypothetical protein KUTeg_010406 [Tegillarca granosa]|uniref:Uncharacterized protein n=1 Tax=Tegillarca granosa TaxID=220873 RepID=A0ABQ9FBJ5_TEGGR|nr:hypothetical protein KUTeg_010406 [Tegillarca granosa]